MTDFLLHRDFTEDRGLLWLCSAGGEGGVDGVGGTALEEMEMEI